MSFLEGVKAGKAQNLRDLGSGYIILLVFR